MPVPLDLLDYDHWLVWRYERPKKAGAKPTKVPYDVKTGIKSDPTSPQTWASYDVVQKSAKNYTGIGFAFDSSDPFAGIDLDGCRDKATGDIAQWAWIIISQVSSYTEVSPSGTGVHILVRGNAPHCGKTPVKDADGVILGSLEMYDKDRYFTVTGNRIDGTPDSIMARQVELDALYGDYFKQSPKPKEKPSESNPREPMSNEDLINQIAGSAQGEKFNRLMQGDSSGYLSRTEAHEALFSLLAWWSKDPEQIKQIAFTSGFADHPNFQREKYLERSINRALELVGDSGYEGAGKSGGALALTDMGNAERLMARHGNKIRFCHAWSRWLIWDGKRWKEDTSGEIVRLAKETVKSIFSEAAKADDDHAKQIAKWAMQSQSVNRIHAMIELTKSAAPVEVDALDADPWLLNCQNGTLELKTDKFREHRQSDYITKVTAVSFQPQAICPQWQAFVAWAMKDDAELIGYLQKALGYGMTGDISEQAIFIPYGLGKNGKSTLFGTVQMLLGDYADSMRSDSLMVKRNNGDIPNDIAALKGQRFIVSSEGEQGQRLAESLIKSLTGGDLIRARFLRAEYFTFPPTHKIFFFTNKKPIVVGTDEGIWRRIHLIPFDAVVTTADKHLQEKLLSEASGILNWLLTGCLAWQKEGLTRAQKVEDATAGYRDEMDVIAAFIAECCVTGQGANEKATMLYEAYKKWCDDNGEYAQKQRFFGVALSDRGYEHYRVAGGKFAWRGIKIREASDDIEDVVVPDVAPDPAFNIATVCEYLPNHKCLEPPYAAYQEMPLCKHHYNQVAMTAARMAPHASM